MSIHCLSYFARKGNTWTSYNRNACYGNMDDHHLVEEMTTMLPYQPEHFSRDQLVKFMTEVFDFFDITDWQYKFVEYNKEDPLFCTFGENDQTELLIVNYKIPKEIRNFSTFLAIGTCLRYIKERTFVLNVALNYNGFPKDWSIVSKIICSSILCGEYGHALVESKVKRFIKNKQEWMLRLAGRVSETVSGGSARYQDVPVDNAKISTMVQQFDSPHGFYHIFEVKDQYVVLDVPFVGRIKPTDRAKIKV